MAEQASLWAGMTHKTDSEPTYRTAESEAVSCAFCGGSVLPQAKRRGYPKRHCSRKCQVAHYQQTHPTVDEVVQKRDKPQWLLIVERLRQGPATRLELFKASGSLNTTGRISEARQRGYEIECDRSGQHPVYWLTSEPGSSRE